MGFDAMVADKNVRWLGVRMMPPRDRMGLRDFHSLRSALLPWDLHRDTTLASVSVSI